jgi:serine protease AprX
MNGFTKVLVLAMAATLASAQSYSGSSGKSGTQGNNNQESQNNQGGNGSQGGQKQSWDFSKYGSGSLVDVIVQFKKNRSMGDIMAVQNFWDASDRQEAGNDSQGEHNLTAINAFHLKVPSWAIPFISAMPNVAYISPVRPVSRTLDVTDGTVAANMAWSYGWTGAGVGVAVIDSGIYGQAPDFANTSGTGSRVVYSESFVSGLDASDQYGHGTHVAGIVGSGGENSTGSGFSRTFKGIAPNVNLINLRVLDANGAGTDANVIAAIQRAIQLKSTYNIRVINLSLGRPVFESYKLDPLCQAVEAAWQAGIVVVTAAGNSGRDNSLGTNGYGTIISPGNDPYVITVGAMNTKGTTYRWDDVIASYSSKGPTLIDLIVKPDLVAPGNNIVSVLAPNSTLATQYPQTLVPDNYYETGTVSGNSGTYLRLSGTSMATPVVAGAAAILIQQNPNITPDQVKARLMKTAGKTLPLYSTATDFWTLMSFSNQSDIFTVGAGELDLNRALTNTDLVDLPALSPTAYIDSATGHVAISRGGPNIWGTTDGIVWGDGLVWGTSVLTGGLTATLDGIVWGDTVFGATDGIVWGDTILTAAPPQALSSGDSDQ